MATLYVVMDQESTKVAADLEQLEDYFRTHPEELKRVLQKENLRLIVDIKNKSYNAQLREELDDRIIQLAKELEAQPEEKKQWWSRRARQVKIEFQEVRWSNSLHSENDNSQIPQQKTQTMGHSMWKIMSGLKKGALALPQNAHFLGKQLWYSRERPTKESFLSGLTAKSWPFVTSVLSWSATTLPAHPEAFFALTGLSFALDAFHGPFAVIWINFQDRLARLKGTAYQAVFNFAYGQAWGYVFKTVSYVGGVGQTSPFSWLFVSVSTLSSLVGDFFGAKGFQAVNRLERLGILSRTHRDAIIQWRDIPWMTQQTMLYTEKWSLFGAFYLLNQGFNVGLWSWAIVGKQQPMLMVVPDEIYESESFRRAYPEAVKVGERQLPPGWKDVPRILSSAITTSFQRVCRRIL